MVTQAVWQGAWICIITACVKVNAAETVAACGTITPSFVNSARLESVKRKWERE